jgi:hypothetical protein
LFLVGVAAWLVGGLGELPHLVAANHMTAANLSFLSLSAWLLSELDRRAGLRRAANAALLLLPVMYAFFTAALASGSHPFGAGGWLAWPLSFAAFYVIAHRHEGAPRSELSVALHAFSAWLACLILGWEAGWVVQLAMGTASAEWMNAARVVPPAIVLSLLPRLASRVPWPFGVHRDTYLSIVGSGLALGLAAWSLISNFLLDGNAAPLPYVPLLNPLDLAQALVLLLLLRHWLTLRAESFFGLRIEAWMPPALLAALKFVWLNGVLLRSLHHWMGVALSFDALAASNVVETCVSIFWSVLALTVMLLASRQGNRPSWLAGGVADRRDHQVVFRRSLERGVHRTHRVVPGRGPGDVGGGLLLAAAAAPAAAARGVLSRARPGGFGDFLLGTALCRGSTLAAGFRVWHAHPGNGGRGGVSRATARRCV